MIYLYIQELSTSQLYSIESTDDVYAGIKKLVTSKCTESSGYVLDEITKAVIIPEDKYEYIELCMDICNDMAINDAGYERLLDILAERTADFEHIELEWWN